RNRTNDGSAVFPSIRQRGPSTTTCRSTTRSWIDAGKRFSSAAPSSLTFASGSLGVDGRFVSWIRLMFRPNAGAATTTPRNASSATRSSIRGARPKMVAVTRTSRPRPIAGARSSRSRRRATRNDDTSALPGPKDAADLDVRELPPDEPDRQDEEDDGGQIDGDDRLPWDDDDRRGDRGRPGLGQRRERQDEPGEDEPEGRSGDQPHDEQEDAFDREPERQL